MNKPLLTFGIPVYNSGKYIDELISYFKPTLDFNYEIIIINDGSNDDSYRQCKMVQKKYSKLNIRIYNQDNHGVSYTRNKIIEYSKGKWITFIDSDDLIDFDLYNFWFNRVINNDIDFYINVYNEKNYKNLKKQNKPLSFLIEKEIINSPCTKFYKKNILIDNKLQFDCSFDLGEDLIFNLKYYKIATKKDFFYSNMYNYRRVNSNSLTLKIRKNKFSELMAVNEECYKHIEKETKLFKAMEYIRIKNNISCLKDYIKLGVNKKTILEKINKINKKYKKKFIILNNCYTTIIYNMWYILPKRLFIRLVKVIFYEKN